MSSQHFCHLHPGVVLVCPACLGAAGGRIGGKVSSPKKAKAARRNASRPRPGRKAHSAPGSTSEHTPS